MNRLEAFRSLSSHAWHGKFFKKLTKSDLSACEEFIKVNDELSPGDFEHAANRWFLDRPKPKNWTLMWGFVMAANTSSQA